MGDYSFPSRRSTAQQPLGWAFSWRKCLARSGQPVSSRATVVQLADALYNGQDCGFALHDALLEAGHPDLAEHFPQEQHHPKGCWGVDLLLGKEE